MSLQHPSVRFIKFCCSLLGYALNLTPLFILTPTVFILSTRVKGWAIILTVETVGFLAHMGYKWGYDRNGYDKRGYDKQGYDKYGYNIRKEDRAGHSRDYYKEREEKYRNKLSEAVQELHDHDYSHALSDSRVIMDEVLRNIVGHYKVNQESNDMLTNLKICEELKIFDEEDLGALHAVRKKCNSNGHDIDAVETMSHNAIHFVVMQVADLLEQSKTLLDIQE